MTESPLTPPPQAGFRFNHPTIVALCYLGSTITGVSGLVGLILAYVWRGEPHEPWESSHYTYLIRTFWLGMFGMMIGILLSIVLIGAFVIAAVVVLVVVRCVLSILAAQREAPMPDPMTLTA